MVHSIGGSGGGISVGAYEGRTEAAGSNAAEFGNSTVGASLVEFTDHGYVRSLYVRILDIGILLCLQRSRQDIGSNIDTGDGQGRGRDTGLSGGSTDRLYGHITVSDDGSVALDTSLCLNTDLSIRHIGLAADSGKSTNGLSGLRIGCGSIRIGYIDSTGIDRCVGGIDICIKGTVGQSIHNSNTDGHITCRSACFLRICLCEAGSFVQDKNGIGSDAGSGNGGLALASHLRTCFTDGSTVIGSGNGLVGDAAQFCDRALFGAVIESAHDGNGSSLVALSVVDICIDDGAVQLRLLISGNSSLQGIGDRIDECHAALHSDMCLGLCGAVSKDRYGIGLDP